LTNGFLEALAKRGLARQLWHSFDSRPAIRTPDSAHLNQHRDPVFAPRQIPHFPLNDFVDFLNVPSAAGANSLLRACFAPHPKP